MSSKVKQEIHPCLEVIKCGKSALCANLLLPYNNFFFHIRYDMAFIRFQIHFKSFLLKVSINATVRLHHKIPRVMTATCPVSNEKEIYGINLQESISIYYNIYHISTDYQIDIHFIVEYDLFML